MIATVWAVQELWERKIEEMGLQTFPKNRDQTIEQTSQLADSNFFKQKDYNLFVH